MGKKRKASNQPKGTFSDLPNPERTKLSINSYEDVADSEDEFLVNRDKILLDEGREAKRRRRVQEEEHLLEPSDEEVLPYPTSDIDDDEISDFEDNYNGAKTVDGTVDVGSVGMTKPANGRRNFEESDDDDDDGWGDTHQDFYGADNIDTEQAALGEEAEAKRLQERQLQGMADVDPYFGVGSASDEGEGDGLSDDDNVVTEVLPELEIPETLTTEERLRLLNSRYPELSSVAEDWLELHERYEQAAKDAKLVPQVQELQKSVHGAIDGQSHLATILYIALSTYLGACAMYFAVLTSTATSSFQALPLAPKALREHPAIQNLLEARQVWEEIKQHQRPNLAAELLSLERQLAIKEKTNFKSQSRSQQATDSQSDNLVKVTEEKKKASRTAEKAPALPDIRRLDRLRQVEADLAELDSLAIKKPKRSAPSSETRPLSKLVINDDDSDLGDDTELTAKELAAKVLRKKSLKFYTSQIAQKVNKQGVKGREAGGDTDIPYRERLKDRESRLNAAAKRRGEQALRPGEELGVGSSDEDADVAPGRRMKQSYEDDDDDYYDMVAARSKQKKADKKAAANAFTRATKGSLEPYAEEALGPDDKRKLTYDILKNKGLTPHRKKEVRNPRVKKKLKYASKLKKLGSVKQVYKGGESKGGYGGELSGIKTDLVKSIKM